MKELGITKGEFISTHNASLERGVREIKKGFVAFLPKPHRFTGQDKRYENELSEYKANAELITDTFNTAQKTGLLPSELLQRYNEAIEVLEQLYNSCAPTNVELRNGEPRWGSCGVPSDESIYNAKQTISKAKP